MTNKIILLVLGTAIALSAVYYFVQNKPSENPPNQTETDTAIVETSPVSNNNSSLTLDQRQCSLHPNGNYLCPAEALKSFGPITITNTGTNTECTISYDQTSGFSFVGATESGNIPAGELATSPLVTKSGNIIRSEKQSLSLHTRDDGTIDHILFVGINYRSEQCLAVL